MKILITLLLIINLIINSLFLKNYFIKPRIVKFDEKQVEYLLQKRQLSLNKPLYIESQFLCDIASIRLEEIQKNWSHDGFINRQFCPKLCSLGENLARNYETELETITAWEGSFLHKDILDHSYAYFCVKSANNHTVAIFGNF